MADRHLVRIDADLYAHFRNQGHEQHRHATALVNELLRYALPLAEAGVFNLPHDVILTALEHYGEQLLARAEANGVPAEAIAQVRKSVRDCHS